jgi:hypothetical protein
LTPKSEFWVRQKKFEKSSRLRNQSDKVSQLSEPIRNIAEPPRNKAANRGNKHQPKILGRTGLLDSNKKFSVGGRP